MTTIPCIVTAGLLAEAIPQSCTRCLVALLLQQATGHRWDIHRRHTVRRGTGIRLEGYRAYDLDDPHVPAWDFPPSLVGLVNDFDASWERETFLGMVIQIPARLVPQPQKGSP